jgi:2-dehydropantoate 2-reductase
MHCTVNNRPEERGGAFFELKSFGVGEGTLRKAESAMTLLFYWVGVSFPPHILLHQFFEMMYIRDSKEIVSGIFEEFLNEMQPLFFLFPPTEVLKMTGKTEALKERVSRRLAVIGAGAVGSALGALLHRAGQDVVLIARPEHAAAIREHGLRVDGDMGDFVAPVEAVETLDFKPDLALLTVKTQDVVAAVKANQVFLKDVPVVTFQNGVRSDELVANILSREQTLSAVVLMHVTYLLPGKVTVVYRGKLILGRPFGPRDNMLEDIARILNQAAPTRVTDNIQGAHWLKLIVNLNNALPAITHFTMSDVYRNSFLRSLAVGLMREGLRVIDRANIRLESLPEVTVGLTRLINWMPLGIAGRIAAAKVRRLTTVWPLWGSTLQSIQRGRPTEIDYLNGEIVELGERYGEVTPLNGRIVELIHQVERTGQFLSVEEIQRKV